MDNEPEDQIDPDVAANEAVADEIDNFDFDRATKLMGILEKVSNASPMSTAILGLATSALKEMNEEAKDIARRRAEAFAKAQAERDRLIAERQAREAHEQDEASLVRAVPERKAIPAGNYDPTPGQPQRRPQDQEKPRGPAASATSPTDNRRL